MPVCRTYATEATHIFLAALAELAICLAHLLMVGSHDRLNVGSTMNEKIVVLLSYVPLSFLSLFVAVVCLLQPFISVSRAYMTTWLACRPGWDLIQATR